METETEYERPPEEDEERQPRRRKREKRRAFAIVRDPYGYNPLRVTDDDDPDEVIEQFIAEGKCDWLEKNDPELAQKIRQQFYERVNDLKRSAVTRRRRH
jgi:hypothetical protein